MEDIILIVERLRSTTFIKDTREILQEIKVIVRENPNAVVEYGLDAILALLRAPSPSKDEKIIESLLEIILEILIPTVSVQEQYYTQSVDVAKTLANDPQIPTNLFSFASNKIEEPSSPGDGKVPLSQLFAIQILTILVRTVPKEMVKPISKLTTYIQRLLPLLSSGDSGFIGDLLLLFIDLTALCPDIRTQLAFENAFEAFLGLALTKIGDGVMDSFGDHISGAFLVSSNLLLACDCLQVVNTMLEDQPIAKKLFLQSSMLKDITRFLDLVPQLRQEAVLLGSNFQILYSHYKSQAIDTRAGSSEQDTDEPLRLSDADISDLQETFLQNLQEHYRSSEAVELALSLVFSILGQLVSSKDLVLAPLYPVRKEESSMESGVITWKAQLAPLDALLMWKQEMLVNPASSASGTDSSDGSFQREGIDVQSLRAARQTKLSAAYKKADSYLQSVKSLTSLPGLLEGLVQLTLQVPTTTPTMARFWNRCQDRKLKLVSGQVEVTVNRPVPFFSDSDSHLQEHSSQAEHESIPPYATILESFFPFLITESFEGMLAPREYFSSEIRNPLLYALQYPVLSSKTRALGIKVLSLLNFEHHESSSRFSALFVLQQQRVFKKFFPNLYSHYKLECYSNQSEEIYFPALFSTAKLIAEPSVSLEVDFNEKSSRQELETIFTTPLLRYSAAVLLVSFFYGNEHQCFLAFNDIIANPPIVAPLYLERHIQDGLPLRYAPPDIAKTPALVTVTTPSRSPVEMSPDFSNEMDFSMPGIQSVNLPSAGALLLSSFLTHQMLLNSTLLLNEGGDNAEKRATLDPAISTDVYAYFSHAITSLSLIGHVLSVLVTPQNITTIPSDKQSLHQSSIQLLQRITLESLFVPGLSVFPDMSTASSEFANTGANASPSFQTEGSENALVSATVSKLAGSFVLSKKDTFVNVLYALLYRFCKSSNPVVSATLDLGKRAKKSVEQTCSIPSFTSYCLLNLLTPLVLYHQGAALAFLAQPLALDYYSFLGSTSTLGSLNPTGKQMVALFFTAIVCSIQDSSVDNTGTLIFSSLSSFFQRIEQKLSLSAFSFLLEALRTTPPNLPPGKTGFRKLLVNLVPDYLESTAAASNYTLQVPTAGVPVACPCTSFFVDTINYLSSFYQSQSLAYVLEKSQSPGAAELDASIAALCANLQPILSKDLATQPNAHIFEELETLGPETKPVVAYLLSQLSMYQRALASKGMNTGTAQEQVQLLEIREPQVANTAIQDEKHFPLAEVGTPTVPPEVQQQVEELSQALEEREAQCKTMEATVEEAQAAIAEWETYCSNLRAEHEAAQMKIKSLEATLTSVTSDTGFRVDKIEAIGNLPRDSTIPEPLDIALDVLAGQCQSTVETLRSRLVQMDIALQTGEFPHTEEVAAAMHRYETALNNLQYCQKSELVTRIPTALQSVQDLFEQLITIQPTLASNVVSEVTCEVTQAPSLGHVEAVLRKDAEIRQLRDQLTSGILNVQQLECQVSTLQETLNSVNSELHSVRINSMNLESQLNEKKQSLSTLSGQYKDSVRTSQSLVAFLMEILQYISELHAQLNRVESEKLAISQCFSMLNQLYHSLKTAFSLLGLSQQVSHDETVLLDHIKQACSNWEISGHGSSRLSHEWSYFEKRWNELSRYIATSLNVNADLSQLPPLPTVQYPSTSAPPTTTITASVPPIVPPSEPLGAIAPPIAPPPATMTYDLQPPAHEVQPIGPPPTQAFHPSTEFPHIVHLSGTMGQLPSYDGHAAQTDGCSPGSYPAESHSSHASYAFSDVPSTMPPPLGLPNVAPIAPPLAPPLAPPIGPPTIALIVPIELPQVPVADAGQLFSTSPQEAQEAQVDQAQRNQQNEDGGGDGSQVTGVVPEGIKEAQYPMLGQRGSSAISGASTTIFYTKSSQEMAILSTSEYEVDAHSSLRESDMHPYGMVSDSQGSVQHDAFQDASFGATDSSHFQDHSQVQTYWQPEGQSPMHTQVHAQQGWQQSAMASFDSAPQVTPETIEAQQPAIPFESQVPLTSEDNTTGVSLESPFLERQDALVSGLVEVDLTPLPRSKDVHSHSQESLANHISYLGATAEAGEPIHSYDAGGNYGLYPAGDIHGSTALGLQTVMEESRIGEKEYHDEAFEGEGGTDGVDNMKKIDWRVEAQRILEQQLYGDDADREEAGKENAKRRSKGGVRPSIGWLTQGFFSRGSRNDDEEVQDDTEADMGGTVPESQPTSDEEQIAHVYSNSYRQSQTFDSMASGILPRLEDNKPDVRYEANTTPRYGSIGSHFLSTTSLGAGIASAPPAVDAEVLFSAHGSSATEVNSSDFLRNSGAEPPVPVADMADADGWSTGHDGQLQDTSQPGLWTGSAYSTLGATSDGQAPYNASVPVEYYVQPQDHEYTSAQGATEYYQQYQEHQQHPHSSVIAETPDATPGGSTLSVPIAFPEPHAETYAETYTEAYTGYYDGSYAGAPAESFPPAEQHTPLEGTPKAGTATGGGGGFFGSLSGLTKNISSSSKSLLSKAQEGMQEFASYDGKLDAEEGDVGKPRRKLFNSLVAVASQFGTLLAGEDEYWQEVNRDGDASAQADSYPSEQEKLTYPNAQYDANAPAVYHGTVESTYHEEQYAAPQAPPPLYAVESTSAYPPVAVADIAPPVSEPPTAGLDSSQLLTAVPNRLVTRGKPKRKSVTHSFSFFGQQQQDQPMENPLEHAQSAQSSESNQQPAINYTPNASVSSLPSLDASQYTQVLPPLPPAPIAPPEFVPPSTLSYEEQYQAQPAALAFSVLSMQHSDANLPSHPPLPPPVAIAPPPIPSITPEGFYSQATAAAEQQNIASFAQALPPIVPISMHSSARSQRRHSNISTVSTESFFKRQNETPFDHAPVAIGPYNPSYAGVHYDAPPQHVDDAYQPFTSAPIGRSDSQSMITAQQFFS